MFTDNHLELEILAFEAWVRRGQPIGSPEVDWEEALKLLAGKQNDQAVVTASPGSTPTDLGAELLPETEHDQPNSKRRRTK